MGFLGQSDQKGFRLVAALINDISFIGYPCDDRQGSYLTLLNQLGTVMIDSSLF